MPGATDFLGDAYYNANPLAAFFKRFNLGSGAPRQRAFGNYANSRYNDIYSRYQAQLPDNPNQGFYDFLGGQDLNSEFSNLAPQQRQDRSFNNPNAVYKRRRYF